MSGATPIGNMVIKLGLDDADFGRGVANSKKQVRYLAKEMQANMRISDMAGNKMGKLGSRYDGLTKIIGAQEKQVSALKQAYDESFVDGKATESTKRLAGEYEDARGKLISYNMQLQNTAGQMARMKVETEGVTGWLNKHGDAYVRQGEKIEKFGSSVSKIGTGLTIGVTAPIVASAFAVSKAAISWESSFAGVKKTTDEVVDSNGKVVYSYDDLESSLRSLATQLPSTHSEIASVAEAAGQLGIKTEDVTSFTKTMIDMGESTNLSAEEAATAIAKIANITGMTSSEYERFGSSVVALGNNFATTEADIVQMANRLAAAGTLAGLSNQEILGLATAMSSVGIEAEAGGTAMTQTLTEIEKAVVNSSDELQKFAEIAGMSAEQFSSTWETKPIEAVQSFIKGLGGLDAKGESATLVLDELGLSGIRQSNMLKSLSLASGTLTDAVGMSTEAWDENTALTNEAGTRYETTESKLKMLKNEVTDAAIEFGGPLVDALRDGLEASKPLIEGLGDLAKSFSSLDEEQQQNIIKWGLMAAAAGPALKLIGGGASLIGKTTTGIGKLSKGVVGLVAASAEKKAIAGLATTITGVGTAATTAAGTGAVGATGAGIAGLGATVAGLAGPIAIGVAAIGTVATAVYLGKKAYDEHQLSGAKWGTAVTEEQDKVLKKHKELVDVAAVNMKEYEAGVKDSAENVKESFNGIAESINESIERQKEALDKSVELLNENQQDDAQKEVDKQKDKLDKEMELVKSQVETINGIYDNASQNKRKLSAEETEYIKYLSKDLTSAQVKNLGLTEDENKRILSRMSLDMSNWSGKQFNDYKKNLRKQLDSGKESLEEQVKSLKEIYKDNPIKLDEEIQKATKSHEQATDDMVRNLAEAVLASGGQLSLMEGDWKRWGYTTEEVAALVSNNLRDTVQNVELFAQGTKEADMAWNTMVFDPKTGEVKDNLTEFLSGIAKTDEGWEQLKLITKEANLTTNARDEIAIAIGESGRWNDLSVDEKNVVVNGDQAKLALFEAINEVEGWDKVEPLIKELGVHNLEAVTKLITSQELLEKYEDLTPEEKSLLIDASQGKEITMTADKLESYKKIKDLAKHLQVTADTSGADEAQRAINNVNDKNVYIRVKYQGANTGQVAMRATGTNYHEGGDMIVNDQKGPLYKEIVHEPGKQPYIPIGRNVYIPNAKRGTKVYKASRTKSIMQRLGVPRYADGVGVPEDSKIIRNLRSFTTSTNESAVKTINYGPQINELISIMSNFSRELRNLKIVMRDKEVADVVTVVQKQEDSRLKRLGGESV